MQLESDDNEIETLLQFTKDNFNKASAMIIFCEKKSRVDKVHEALKAAGVLCLPFEESMSS